jgi:hypothetical protein
VANQSNLTVRGIDIRSRQFRVSQVLASTRLEGVATPRSWRETLKKYAEGEISDEELVALANRR